MIEVTFALPPNAAPDQQPTKRYFPVHSTLVCVEIRPGRIVQQKVDVLKVGDKVCVFGRPNPGPGVEVTSVKVV